MRFVFSKFCLFDESSQKKYSFFKNTFLAKQIEAKFRENFRETISFFAGNLNLIVSNI